MRLKEHEGKRLLSHAGIATPAGDLVTAPDQTDRNNAVVKIQRLTGGRKKEGGIRFTETRDETRRAVKELLDAFDTDEILVEERLSGPEYYIGCTFDTKKRVPVLVLSPEGGVDVEDWRGSDKIVTRAIDTVTGLQEWMVREAWSDAGFEQDLHSIASLACTLYKFYRDNDVKTVEINPVISTEDGLYAADAHVILDDDGMYRQDFEVPERVGLREQNEREERAREINASTHRGVAGKTYLDLDGDIAVLASGGGASVTAMDAILTYGGALANYTEYSGNPPPEQVRELADLVLSKDGLHGCFIVGGRANFTRIDDTLEAIFDVLAERKAVYPIVVRRAGPGDEQGFEIARSIADEHGLDLTLYDDTTPITVAAKEMVERAEAHRGDTH